MTGSDEISAPDLARGLRTAAQRVVDARDELCRLDAAAGDGDLGVTLGNGFERTAPDPDEVADMEPGAMLRRIGMGLAEHAPSTSGTLIAGALVAAGTKLAGRPRLDAGDVATLLRVCADAVAQRGRSAVGERTMLDAMSPAADAAAQAAADGSSIATTLRAAADAAARGADATAELPPRHGRAMWIGDRVVGTKDAGAEAWALYLDGLADGVASAGLPT